MQDQIEEVKQKTDIVAVIGERVKLTKAGKHHKGLCPFHSEKTPSFTVSPELQIFKCFGCGESGDAFSFLEKYEGMEFSEALRFLAQKAGVELKRINSTQITEKEILYNINLQAAHFYHYLLTKHISGKEALIYVLQQRGLSKQTVVDFQIGFAPENSTALMKYLIRKKYKQTDIERAGLIVKVDRGGRSTYFDRFRGRVIFPLFDHRGNCVGLAGRILPGHPNEKRLAKYINSPETLVYHKSNVLYGLNVTRGAIKKLNTAIVVEGEVDLLSSYQAGVQNVVALKGTALTEEQIRLLSRLCTNIVLALDADLAGDNAARRGVSLAQNAGLTIKVLKQSKYKDPDEFARGDSKGYKLALENSIGVWDFLIESIIRKFDSSTGEGKAAISRELTPLLSTIEDSIVEAHYMGVVAQKLGVSIDAVSRQINKGTPTKQESVIKVNKPKQASRYELLEYDLLGLAFCLDPTVLLIPEHKELFVSVFNKKIIEQFEQFSKANSFSLALFSESLPLELKPQFLELILRAETEFNESQDATQVVLLIRELQKQKLKDIARSLSNDIALFEASGEDNKSQSAQQELNSILQKLAAIERQ